MRKYGNSVFRHPDIVLNDIRSKLNSHPHGVQGIVQRLHASGMSSNEREPFPCFCLHLCSLTFYLSKLFSFMQNKWHS
ncbi:hypothetical protein D3C81_1839430 [compost metagenome]